MWKVVAVVAVAVVIAFSAFVAATAQGAPGAPTAKASSLPNPALSQDVQVTFASYVYSLVAPNSVYQLGGKFVYSATATNPSNGPPVVLAQNASAAFSATSSKGQLYTVESTVTFSLPALCSGSSCSTSVYNLTITVKAVLSTFVAFWQSSESKIVFSNVASYISVPPLTAPSPSTYYLELVVPITVIVAVGALAAAGLGPGPAKHPAVILVGLGATFAVLGELLVWL